MSIRVTDANGVLRELWDDAGRTYTAWDAAGVQTLQRPYTATENARADAEAAAVLADGNQRTIAQALDADLTDMQTLIDTQKSTINADAATYIKMLARVLRRVIRLLIRRFDGTS